MHLTSNENVFNVNCSFILDRALFFRVSINTYQSISSSYFFCVSLFFAWNSTKQQMGKWTIVKLWSSNYEQLIERMNRQMLWNKNWNLNNRCSALCPFLNPSRDSLYLMTDVIYGCKEGRWKNYSLHKSMSQKGRAWMRLTTLTTGREVQWNDENNYIRRDEWWRTLDDEWQ